MGACATVLPLITARSRRSIPGLFRSSVFNVRKSVVPRLHDSRAVTWSPEMPCPEPQAVRRFVDLPGRQRPLRPAVSYNTWVKSHRIPEQVPTSVPWSGFTLPVQQILQLASSVESGIQDVRDSGDTQTTLSAVADPAVRSTDGLRGVKPTQVRQTRCCRVGPCRCSWVLRCARCC